MQEKNNNVERSFVWYPLSFSISQCSGVTRPSLAKKREVSLFSRCGWDTAGQILQEDKV